LYAAFLGFTILAAELFSTGPLISWLSGINLYGGHPSISPLNFFLLKLLLTYGPAALITAWFFHATKLMRRAPSPIPGVTFIRIGVSIQIFSWFLQLLAFNTQKGGLEVIVAMWLPVILWPAQALLVVGSVQLLLGVRAAPPTLSAK
jgi:hypothetical protein